MREQLALALVAHLALVDDLVAVDVRLDLLLEVLAVRLLQHAGHDELAVQPLGGLDAVVEALGLADAAEGQQVVVLLGRVRPLLDGDGVVGEAGPAHAGRRHRALVLADADVADLVGELLVEAVGELVEGAVHGVDHRRRQVAAEGDAEEPGVVVHEVEPALPRCRRRRTRPGGRRRASRRSCRASAAGTARRARPRCASRRWRTGARRGRPRRARRRAAARPTPCRRSPRAGR